ncbi:cytochrome P450 [Xylariaceae sp. FL1272]|nr:cytochrome P450 [Xylariaceae sp. FL1272]
MGVIEPLLKAALGFLIAVATVQIANFLSKGWEVRTNLRKLQKQGKPMEPHSLLMGHLLHAKTATEELPPGAHSNYVLNRMATRMGNPEAFYFDVWPVADPMLIVTDQYLAEQVTSHHLSGGFKPPSLTRWFAPISGRGGLNLFVQNGQDWKRDHETFMPWFSNTNLDATLPAIIDEMLIFRDILREKAQSKDMIRLEPLTLRLMNDIIGRVIFNTELKNQTSDTPHPLSQYMIHQLDSKFQENDAVQQIGRLSPLYKLGVWNNGRNLDREISVQINRRVDALRAAKWHGESSLSSMLDRVLMEYFSKPERQRVGTVDTEFMKMLVCQLRLLFFAGYDSTSSTMISLCYIIWTHPEVLAKLRTEHDDVFGRNVESCAGQIVENPAILNSLSYTNAVIKEAMRLLPPASGVRQGCRDLVLRGRDGAEYPTDGYVVNTNHMGVMRNPKTWPRPLEFLPERFLVGPGHELYPPKGAWRPFENGLRTCTGQAFVLKELRAFLALVAREFDFKEAYDEAFAGEKIDLTGVYGEKAYLIEAGSAHPRGEFPCRIALSGYGNGK